MTARGDTLECRVESLAYGGDGIARVNGMVIFIPGALPDETVRATVSVVKKNYARAELTGIVSPSPQRIQPCCRVADPCSGTSRRVPGCVYDHLEYAAEVAAKQLQLQGFLRRMPYYIGTAEMLPPLPSPQPLNYRNKIVMHTRRTGSGMGIGYMLEQSHRLLDVAACPLACASINSALAELRASDTSRKLRDGADITFRHTPQDGTLCWADSGGVLPMPQRLITEVTAAGNLLVPCNGFFQVNPLVGDELTRALAAWFADGPAAAEVLDLFCGVGVFGFACMAAGAVSLTGVESGRDAVAAARLNAEALGMPAAFICGEIGRDSNSWTALVREPDNATVIVDPPREGLPPSAAAALAGSGVRRVFYVSCDPATLARDLQTLLQGAYRIRRVRLFDMFPRTAHFETLVELHRP